MADQTNPFTMAGMMGMMMPNKYIDPAYKDKSLPLPGFYGAPTDAQGNPIQSFTDAQTAHDAWNAAHPAPAAPAQGTTLNTSPYVRTAVGTMNLTGQPAPAGTPPPDVGLNYLPNAFNRVPTGGDGNLGGSQQTQPAAQQNPIDMRQAYLNALSSPGKVTTPGASVPQAQPLGTPSVMDSFMAAHPGGGGAGASNYSNTGFFDTLNKLRAS